MGVICTNIENNHLFSGNPIAEQHKLRHKSIIERQNWDVPVIKNMEYDQYDNPSSTYFIWRDNLNQTRGAMRFYPTDRPFMLLDSFKHTVKMNEIPSGDDVVEGSRFCIDNNAPYSLRARIARELVCAGLEHCFNNGITKIVGIMYPVYWKNLFFNNGINVEWLGSSIRLSDGNKARSGCIYVTNSTLKSFREKTGIYNQIIKYQEQEFGYKIAS